jgi:shikimate dehydrogenase
MKIYGLIGNPIRHSLSQEYFTEKFLSERIEDCVYELFPLREISALIPLIKQKSEISGLNVTIPFKKQVTDYLDEIDGVAREIGAVNCIRVSRKSGQPYLEGFNTDVYGFEHAIVPCLEAHHKNALILGTGGSSGSVAHVLQKLGIGFTKVSRHPKCKNEVEFGSLTPEMMAHFTIIINSTPVGMFPDTDQCPAIPYESITHHHLLFDLVYNPGETVFMKHGRSRGAKVMNGIEMLHMQAEKSWEIWME